LKIGLLTKSTTGKEWQSEGYEKLTNPLFWPKLPGLK